MLDGLGMGLGFTLAITLLSCVRELLGAGTIFGVAMLPETFQPMTIAVQPAGGFILLGQMCIRDRAWAVPTKRLFWHSLLAPRQCRKRRLARTR